VTACAGEDGAASGPLTADELRRSVLRPDLLSAHVLDSVDRVARNLAAGEGLWMLIVVLSGASLVATVPFGALSPVASWWKVSVLFTGSLLICLPCLHVFLQFLGFRISLVGNLSLSLVITATAGLFTFGFFPIVWFIDLTTRAGDGTAVPPAALARFLLGVSLVLGIVQMIRCLASSRGGVLGRRAVLAPIVLWLPLLVFIVWRMADVLGLRG
jgi:hypothetical protein